MARIARVVVPGFAHHVVQRGVLWLDRHDYTNYELPLRTHQPLGPTAFLDQLEQLIGTSLRRKKGGWQKVTKRK